MNKKPKIPKPNTNSSLLFQIKSNKPNSSLKLTTTIKSNQRLSLNTNESKCFNNKSSNSTSTSTSTSIYTKPTNTEKNKSFSINFTSLLSKQQSNSSVNIKDTKHKSMSSSSSNFMSLLTKNNFKLNQSKSMSNNIKSIGNSLVSRKSNTLSSTHASTISPPSVMSSSKESFNKNYLHTTMSVKEKEKDLKTIETYISNSNSNSNQISQMTDKHVSRVKCKKSLSYGNLKIDTNGKEGGLSKGNHRFYSNLQLSSGKNDLIEDNILSEKEGKRRNNSIDLTKRTEKKSILLEQNLDSSERCENNKIITMKKIEKKILHIADYISDANKINNDNIERKKDCIDDKHRSSLYDLLIIEKIHNERFNRYKYLFNKINEIVDGITKNITKNVNQPMKTNNFTMNIPFKDNESYVKTNVDDEKIETTTNNKAKQNKLCVINEEEEPVSIKNSTRGRKNSLIMFNNQSFSFQKRKEEESQSETIPNENMISVYDNLNCSEFDVLTSQMMDVRIEDKNENVNKINRLTVKESNLKGKESIQNFRKVDFDCGQKVEKSKEVNVCFIF